MFCCNRHMGLLKVHLKYAIMRSHWELGEIYERSYKEGLKTRSDFEAIFNYRYCTCEVFLIHRYCICE